MQLNYDSFEALCIERGKAATTAAMEAGIARNQPGQWKRGAEISPISLRKLAKYFDVSPDSLTGSAHTITASDRSTVAVGNSGTVATNGGTVSNAAAAELSDMEIELLRIFRSLNMRQKNAAMSYFYDMEDTMKKEG